MQNEEKNLRARANEMHECSSPEGTFENSPAFQRREVVDYRTSPAGTTESAMLLNRPFGTRALPILYPALKCRAIVKGSFGTNWNHGETTIAVWRRLFFILHPSFYISA